ncbi:MAG: hypothetical protein GY698_18135 [Actinomycetia bacterium]|nr:hypothetical protein [Actinomycetes bacterium]
MAGIQPAGQPRRGRSGHDSGPDDPNRTGHNRRSRFLDHGITDPHPRDNHPRDNHPRDNRPQLNDH